MGDGEGGNQVVWHWQQQQQQQEQEEEEEVKNLDHGKLVMTKIITIRSRRKKRNHHILRYWMIKELFLFSKKKEDLEPMDLLEKYSRRHS